MDFNNGILIYLVELVYLDGLMTSGKGVTANPWHAVASLALYEMPTELKSLGIQVVNVFSCSGCNDDYKCWGQDFLFFYFFESAFDHLQKETDKPRALIS